MAARLRRGLGMRRVDQPIAEPAPPPTPTVPSPTARGLGEPPSGPREQAGEAELDTLRGELVRELDRLAEGDEGSASFRRAAS